MAKETISEVEDISGESLKPKKRGEKRKKKPEYLRTVGQLHKV